MRDSQPAEEVRTRDRDASDHCYRDRDVRLTNGALVCLRYGYVCASKTMALRRLLEAANSNTGFTNQEKGVCVCVCVCLSVFVCVCVWIPACACDQTEECCHAVFLLRPSDPEEFLNKLFQLLRVEPLLKIR